MAPPSALVTGATGYVASELIRQLLAKGYAVRATVRCDPAAPRLQYLRDLAAGASSGGSLALLQVADLQAASSELDDAIAGCNYVFHVASPFRFDGDRDRDIVQPAVRGTRTVLEAAARHKAAGLKRVIVTSSVCAIHDQHRKQPPKGASHNEEDWNEVSTLEAEPYWVSKVEAERLAWQLAEELGLDVVTILPNFVLGPVFSGQQCDGVSIGFMKDILESPASKAFSGSWTVEDVRDVARAHILAAEAPAAKGRYIVSQPDSISAAFVSATIKNAWPAAAAALPDGEDAPVSHIDSSRVVRELGLQLTPVADTVRDMAASLLTHGIAKPAWFAAAPTAA